MLQSKAEFRKKYRTIRQEIPKEMRVQASVAVASHLAADPIFLESERIACYISIDNEIDTMPIIQKIWQMNKACYLPVMLEGKSLGFARYQEGDPLRKNPYQIFEPEKGARILPENLDLVMMPLTVFDLNGHRIGTGGGYYDRTFAFLHGKSAAKPFFLGVGFSVQRVKALPSDPWDVLMHGAVTEEGVIRFPTHY